MNRVVLLRGFLDSRKIKRAIEEILSVSQGDMLTLVIDSDGGNLSPAIKFIEFLEKKRGHGIMVNSRIYNAKSMASIIALSANFVEMDRGATLELHQGSLHLESSDFDLSGQISNDAMAQFVKYRQLLQNILDKYRIQQNPKMMAELSGSNWLKLSAKECKERYIIDEIF